MIHQRISPVSNTQFSGQFIQPVATSYHTWPRYEGRGGRPLHNLRGSHVAMGFRGRPGFVPMRMPRGGPRFPYGRIMKRGFIRRPYEFKKLPDSARYKEFQVSPENLVCFSGFQNVFTAQHDFQLEIDGRVYDNVNHFYQLAKTEALCGVTSLLMTGGGEENGRDTANGPKDYNTLARNILKINKVSRSAAEEWRKGPGLEAMQRALLAKVEQCEELRKELLASGNDLLVHCFGGDDFYATACNHKYIQDWARSMQNNKVVIKLPLEFPLNADTVLSIPKFGLGRNVLGVIYMQLREMLRDGHLPYKGKTTKVDNDEHNVEMHSEELTGPSIVPSVPAPMKNEPRESMSKDGFIIGGGSIQSKFQDRSNPFGSFSCMSSLKTRTPKGNTPSRNVLTVPLEYIANFSSK